MENRLKINEMKHIFGKSLALITSLTGAALAILATPLAGRAVTVSLEYKTADLSQWTPDVIDPSYAALCQPAVANSAFCNLGNQVVNSVFEANPPAPGSGQPDYYVLILNNTPYNISSIQYSVPSTGDLQFDVGNTKSDIFSNITGDPYNLAFTGGTIQPGQYFTSARYFSETHSKDDPITVGIEFSPVDVPESSSPVFMLAFGALGAGALIKRKLAKNKACSLH